MYFRKEVLKTNVIQNDTLLFEYIKKYLEKKLDIVLYRKDLNQIPIFRFYARHIFSHIFMKRILSTYTTRHI